MANSQLQKERNSYKPRIPAMLAHIGQAHTLAEKGSNASSFPAQVASLFPLTASHPVLNIVKGTEREGSKLTVGVLLSGGQAPGGHNVISGLFDALKQWHRDSRLIGFLNGPKGLVVNNYIDITDSLVAPYRNTGGFDMIGSGRDKIETAEQFESALKTASEHALDGLVIIGGDDSNTNAAFLAEYFAANGSSTAVVGVPKTIDGDLKNEAVEVSFGFDTASKNYSETIGSLMRDALSAKKYYYFIKLMGRSASHITLECALQTHPNMALISEEVKNRGMTLKELTVAIADMVCTRAIQGKEYGVVLIPEGVVEFIPEVGALIRELNVYLSTEAPHHAALEKLSVAQEKVDYVAKLLSKGSLETFQQLPLEIQAQLLIGRDAHGNVQVSKIETERLFIGMVSNELKRRSNEGKYNGSFSPQPHFCGYEGRSCFPSNFDSNYCYALGVTAAVLVTNKASGYLAHVNHLAKSVDEWIPGGAPLASLMKIEERHGKQKAVIERALVDLTGKPFLAYAKERSRWEIEDDYVYTGPIQFFGPPSLADAITHTLALES